MFNFLSRSSASNPIKGFKVARTSNRDKKHGIAANSLEALRNKVTAKFNLEKFNLFLDGSLIDNEEYFLTIPAQSLIILAEDGEEVKTGE